MDLLNAIRERHSVQADLVSGVSPAEAAREMNELVLASMRRVGELVESIRDPIKRRAATAMFWQTRAVVKVDRVLGELYCQLTGPEASKLSGEALKKITAKGAEGRRYLEARAREIVARNRGVVS